LVSKARDSESGGIYPRLSRVHPRLTKECPRDLLYEQEEKFINAEYKCDKMYQMKMMLSLVEAV